MFVIFKVIARHKTYEHVKHQTHITIQSNNQKYTNTQKSLTS